VGNNRGWSINWRIGYNRAGVATAPGVGAGVTSKVADGVPPPADGVSAGASVKIGSGVGLSAGGSAVLEPIGTIMDGIPIHKRLF